MVRLNLHYFLNRGKNPPAGPGVADITGASRTVREIALAIYQVANEHRRYKNRREKDTVHRVKHKAYQIAKLCSGIVGPYTGRKIAVEMQKAIGLIGYLGIASDLRSLQKETKSVLRDYSALVYSVYGSGFNDNRKYMGMSASWNTTEMGPVWLYRFSNWITHHMYDEWGPRTLKICDRQRPEWRERARFMLNNAKFEEKVAEARLEEKFINQMEGDIWIA